MVIVEASAPAASAAARSLTQDSETGGNIPENVQQEAGSQGTTSPSAVTAMMGGGNPGGPVKSQVKSRPSRETEAASTYFIPASDIWIPANTEDFQPLVVQTVLVAGKLMRLFAMPVDIFSTMPGVTQKRASLMAGSETGGKEQRNFHSTI